MAELILKYLGVDIINEEYPPGVFFKGSQIFGQKIKGLKFLGENLRGLKLISKFDHNFFKISIFSDFLGSYRSNYRKNRNNFRNQKSQ